MQKWRQSPQGNLQTTAVGPPGPQGLCPGHGRCARVTGGVPGSRGLCPGHGGCARVTGGTRAMGVCARVTGGARTVALGGPQARPGLTELPSHVRSGGTVAALSGASQGCCDTARNRGSRLRKLSVHGLGPGGPGPCAAGTPRPLQPPGRTLPGVSLAGASLPRRPRCRAPAPSRPHWAPGPPGPVGQPLHLIHLQTPCSQGRSRSHGLGAWLRDRAPFWWTRV